MDLELGEVLARLGEGAGRHLDRVRHAEPAQQAPRRRLRLARGKARPVGKLGDGHHVALELAAVVLEDEPGVVGHGRWRHQVAQAQLEGIDPEIARGEVDQPLDDVGRLGPAGAAIRRVGHRVGEDAGDGGLDARDAIDAGDAADVVEEEQRPARQIAADIDREVHLQRQEAAVCIQAQLGVDGDVAAMVVGKEALPALRDPAHRAAQLARGIEHEHVLGVGTALHAERAADILGHDPHLAGRHLQQIGERAPQSVRALVGGMQHEAAGLIDAAERTARLERERRNPRDVRGEPGDVGCPRDGVARVALAPDEGDVVGRLVPDGRCGGGAGRCHGGKRGHVLRLDDDQLCRGLGRLQRLGDHERHRLADDADAVANQHGTSGLVRLLPVRALQLHAAREVRQSVGGQVLGRVDREHAGQRERRLGVDRGDAGARRLGAHDNGVRHPLGGDIGDIEALARHQAVVLDASLEFTPLAQCCLSDGFATPDQAILQLSRPGRHV